MSSWAVLESCLLALELLLQSQVQGCCMALLRPLGRQFPVRLDMPVEATAAFCCQRDTDSWRLEGVPSSPPPLCLEELLRIEVKNKLGDGAWTILERSIDNLASSKKAGT